MTEQVNGRSPGCLWYLTGQALALGATLLGTAMVSSRWSDCRFGMGVATRATISLGASFAWVGMGVVLFLVQLGLAAALPKRTEPEVKWVVLVVVTLVLFALYVGSMGSPDTSPGGECYVD